MGCLRFLVIIKMIKYEKDICKKCGKEKMIVNKTHHLCYSCNQIRLHGTPHKKRKPTGEMDVFKQIWNDRPHESEISRRGLEVFAGRLSMLFPNMFAHVLSKKSHLSMRNEPDNIMLIHPEEHSLIDQGTEQQRKEYEQKYDCSFDVFYNKKEKLKS